MAAVMSERRLPTGDELRGLDEALSVVRSAIERVSFDVENGDDEYLPATAEQAWAIHYAAAGIKMTAGEIVELAEKMSDAATWSFTESLNVQVATGDLPAFDRVHAADALERLAAAMRDDDAS